MYLICLMNKYIDLLRLKIKGYIIIDDFFPDEICTELREKIYNAEKYNCKYWDYKDLIFDVEGEESIKYISFGNSTGGFSPKYFASVLLLITFAPSKSS